MFLTVFDENDAINFFVLKRERQYLLYGASAAKRYFTDFARTAEKRVFFCKKLNFDSEEHSKFFVSKILTF